ncbi:DUF2029 domain-containing protein, partial [bacterium]|nr:DUF2029 domain-containing protein [bacterium]
FFVAITFHYVLGAYADLSYPYTTFLFNPKDRFSDFFYCVRFAQDRNPYLGDPILRSNYFPFANFIFYVLSLLPRAKNALLLYSATFLLGLFALIYRQLKTLLRETPERLLATFILTLCSAPVLYTLDRGNMEGLLFLGLAVYWLGEQAHLEKTVSKKWGKLGNFALASVISFKLYPALLLLIPLSQRRFKDVGVILTWVFVLSLGSLLTFKGGFFNNLDFILSGFQVGEVRHWNSPTLLQRGVSWFTAFKGIWMQWDGESILTLTSLQKAYLALIGVSTALLSAVVLAHPRATREMQWLVLLSMIVLFPHLSGDYKLIHFIIPLLGILGQPPSKSVSVSQERSRFFLVLLIALVLVPKDYAWLSRVTTDAANISRTGLTPASVAILINPLLLTCILGVSVRELVREHRLNFLSLLERDPPSLKEQ